MFRSIQSKVAISLGILSILISILRHFSYHKILIQAILYILIARDADCMIYGNCYVTSWTIIIIPIIGVLLFTLDYFKIFDNYYDKISKFHSKMEALNKLDLEKITDDSQCKRAEKK